MMDSPGTLHEQVEESAQETAELLSATLPGLPDLPIEVLRHENRSIIRPLDTRGLPLYISGQHLAALKVTIACQLDSVGQYLAVEESTFNLTALQDRTPVLRVHYLRDPGGHPTAHVHFHGHRGALSHLLSQAGHDTPHDVSSLHIPLGGSRFRPCLEDFIQFLICECRFDSRDGWRTAVEDGRERWRRRQAAAVTRDMPDEAARVLRNLGYTVQAPSTPPETKHTALHTW